MWRFAGFVVPADECLAVAALVGRRSAEREDNAGSAASVRQLASDGGRDPRNPSDGELVLLGFDQKGQRACQDEVDLFLTVMAVDAEALRVASG